MLAKIDNINLFVIENAGDLMTVPVRIFRMHNVFIKDDMHMFTTQFQCVYDANVLKTHNVAVFMRDSV